MKFEIELIPKSIHSLSLHNILPRSNWEKIKKDILKKEDKKCWICGEENRLAAHEFWEFDEENLMQKLKEIHHICYLCHGAKHLLMWMKKRDSNKGWSFGFVNKLKKHFCEINNCSEEDLNQHLKEVKAKRLSLDGKNIRIDFGEYLNSMPKLRKEALIREFNS